MKKDILNQTFGLLTVIEKLGSIDYKQHWQCRCICGKLVDKTTESLTCPRNKKHCGCCDRNQFKSGQKFGKLTITKESVKFGSSGKRIKSWECSCECGNITIVNTSDLLSGNTTSCGCTRQNYKVDLTGKVYGRLTVIALDIEKSLNKKDKYWKCQCVCGNTCSPSTNALLSGLNQSCGCIKQDLFKAYRISKGYDPETLMTPHKIALRGRMSGKKPSIMLKYNSKCQLCQEEYTSQELDVHHIVPLSKNDKLFKQENNLIILCKKCHLIAHNNNWQKIDLYIQKKLAAITGLILT
jgi:hypothetical protein